MFDVFVSYEHESRDVADKIVETLTKDDVKCWYAPRDVCGDYATSICNAIMEVPIFIVVMSAQASKSDHVLNEVEMAYMRLRDKAITILPFKVTNDKLSLAMEYYLKRLHWIDSSSIGLQLAIKELEDRVLKLLGRNNTDDRNTTTENVENKYFDYGDKNEIRRLEVQAGIVQQFDQDVYDRVLAGRENLVCFDFGSNDGSSIARRLLHRPEVSKIFGLEYNQDVVNSGNERFKGTKLKLYQTDLEDSNVESTISNILAENQCEKIDVAVCSFILMHMKNQKGLLKAIRKHLSNDGIVIIADVDDNLYMAYPDPKGDFGRAIRLLRKNRYGGNRLNGRSLYMSLKRSGYSDIRLEHAGLNTIGMDFESKEATFDMNFSYLEGDLKLELEKQPDDLQIAENLSWWQENKERLEEEFTTDDFFFMDSTIVFTAKK